MSRVKTTTRKRYSVPSKEEMYEELDSYLTHRKEKESHGEVFTPIRLVEEWCDGFPARIWTQKDRTWLDPASGIGTFMVVVFYRLMDGLENSIPAPLARATHILERMVYMVEMNPTNVRICRALFRRLCPSATLHLHTGDFLAPLPSDWPLFSCVIGNPPYNVGGIKREGTKRVHIPFTEKGLALLEPKGYLGYICPPSYREADTPMNRLFQEAGGHLVYLRILGAKETHRWFKIQARVDLFLYQRDVKGDTRWVDELGEENRARWDMTQHFPNFGWNIFQKLYKAVARLGSVEGFRTSEASTTTIKASPSGSHRLLHLIVEGGRRVVRRTTPHSLETIPKVMINGLGIPYVYYDKEGEYGPTQSPIVILRPNQAVVQLLQSPLFVCIAWGLRLTGNNNLPYVLDAVPRVQHSYAKEIGFTAKEREWIQEHFQVPTFQDKELD